MTPAVPMSSEQRRAYLDGLHDELRGATDANHKRDIQAEIRRIEGDAAPRKEARPRSRAKAERRA